MSINHPRMSKEYRSRADTNRLTKSKQSNCDRDFPDAPSRDGYGLRKAVCKRCHCVMSDIEPCSGNGEYYHPRERKDGKPSLCRNAGKTFTDRDLEIVPFLRKAVRRAYKRNGLRP